MRAFVEVSQHLVAALGIGVVVGVALQVEEEQVGQQEVAVPGMLVGGSLVAPGFQATAVQAVVLDVVDDLQQCEGHHRLTDEVDRADPAEGDAETDQEQRADHVPPDQLVAPVQRRQALALEALFLELPGIQEVVLVGVGQEGVEALAVARGRSVFRRGNMHMVAAHVLHLEARVAHCCQQQAAGVLLQLRVLVDQLVGDGDADGPHHRADRENPAQLADPVPGVVGGQYPAAVDQHAQQ